MHFAPGDIVEIETAAGFAYVQITHTHVAYPEVVRVLRGFYAKRPLDLRLLTELPTRFVAMVPLASALELGRIKGGKVASAAVPESERQFPTFKMPIRDKLGNIVYWWLWAGDGLRYSTERDEASDRYPLREVPTIQSFLSRITEQVEVREPA